MKFISRITLFFLFSTLASYSYAYESSDDECQQGDGDSEESEDDSIIQKIIVIICKKYEDKARPEEKNAVIAVYDPTNATHNFLVKEINGPQTPKNKFMEIMKDLGISEPESSKKLKLGTNAFYFIRDSKISVRDMTAKNPHKFSCKNPVVAINIQDILEASGSGLIQNSYEFTSRTNNIKVTFNLATIELIKQKFNDIKNQFDKIYSF